MYIIADIPLWQTFLSGAEGPLITGMFGFGAGFLIRGWQSKREDLAHKRALEIDEHNYKRDTADRIQSIIFPTYEEVVQLLDTYDAIATDLESAAVNYVVDPSTLDAIGEISKSPTLTKYALINKETELRAALISLRDFFDQWFSNLPDVTSDEYGRAYYDEKVFPKNVEEFPRL